MRLSGSVRPQATGRAGPGKLVVTDGIERRAPRVAPVRRRAQGYQEESTLSNANANANAKEQGILLEGTVVESLKNATFRVKTDNGHEVLAHNSGKMRMHRIRVLPGDRVQVEISPYDLKRGRITYRFK